MSAGDAGPGEPDGPSDRGEGEGSSAGAGAADELDRELEALLRRSGAPSPDPARRGEARRAFLASESRAGGAARTRREMQAAALDPEEEDAFLDWIADLTAESPSAGARQHARLSFLTAVASVAPPPVPRASRRRQVAVLALAAAAILAVSLLLPQDERWRVRLGGSVRLDGREYAQGEEGRLAADLAASGRIETGAAPLRLVLGALDLELQPHAELAVPALPSLDGVSPIELELPRGELFLRTSARWSGNPILVRTPDADVMLHGTTVGVLANELGSCVCVADGTARVVSPNLADSSREVSARSTLRIPARRGAPEESGPFPPEGTPEARHTDPLVGFLLGP